VFESFKETESARVSVVTPTYRRPTEAAGLLANLSQQTCLPTEVIMVDGTGVDEPDTENAVAALADTVPFQFQYIRHERGTAIQRNAGIDKAAGDFIAFIDDDVRLDPKFLATIVSVFAEDKERRIGGIVGYRTNQHFRLNDRQRWRWYRRLKLLTIYEPGKYDFRSGYPINALMQPPFSGLRKVDFMTTACAVWRREVFDSGLRFDPFFRDYGILEDAHLSLRAGRKWELFQCGDAHCVELSSPNGRVNRQTIGFKTVVNHYYVFQDVVGPLTWQHKMRFWRFQAFELLRLTSSAIRRRRRMDLSELQGRLAGFLAVARGLDIRLARALVPPNVGRTSARAKTQKVGRTSLS
jgi:glycosyltransferase involved in cell wall biosynthesis